MTKRKLYFEKVSWLEPETAFLKLFGNGANVFWLDDNSAGKQKFSYMGMAERAVKYTPSNNILSITNVDNSGMNAVNKEQVNCDIFKYLRDELEKHGTSRDEEEVPFAFTGGFVGYLGYEMEAGFLFVDKFLAFDNKRKKLYLACRSKDKNEAQKWFAQTVKLLESAAAYTNIKYQRHETPQSSTLFFKQSRSKKQYLEDIEACKNYLLEGDAYQICLTNQFYLDIETDWPELFLNLRKINPAPYSAFVNFGDFTLISSSPELFLNIDAKRNITSKPMKGTVKRGKTAVEDEIFRDKLGKAEKDFAENAMIVDLVRNDLGRVCETGSVEVVDPLSVETFETVHQLVSTVRGKLKTGKTVIDAIQAAFPGGSMTGAPKIRVMEILAELEDKPRGIYSGCFGYLSLNGAAQLAMTIRTIVAEKDKLTFGSGGAILIDSKPEEEYEEMLLKAKALIEAIVKTAGAKSYEIKP